MGYAETDVGATRGHSAATTIVHVLNVVCVACNDSIGSHNFEELQECMEAAQRVIQNISFSKPLYTGKYAQNIPRLSRGILRRRIG